LRAQPGLQLPSVPLWARRKALQSGLWPEASPGLFLAWQRRTVSVLREHRSNLGGRQSTSAVERNLKKRPPLQQQAHYLVGCSEAYWRMGLRREYVRLLATKVAEDLVKQEMIEFPASLDLANQLFEVMDAEINLEDRINDEVRTMLNQYSNEMRQSGASYQEMFKLIKNKLVKERKLVL
jgi:hypothetical protein